MSDGILKQLAEAHRIGTSVTGSDGETRDASADTLTKILTALGVPCSTEEQIQDSLQYAANAAWRRLLPSAVVVLVDDEATVPVHVPSGTSPELTAIAEDGTRHALISQGTPQTHEVDGAAVDRLTFSLPQLPLGWHRLEATHDGGHAECALIVTPQRLTTGDRLSGSQRWGLMAQLYSVRSAESWGVGDLTDLASLATISAGKGADFVLINPLHAAEPAPPVEPSPYLPSSRRFFNPLYLRVEDVPEFQQLPTTAQNQATEAARNFQDANRDPEFIDRDTSYAAKLSVLKELNHVERSRSREESFRRFCEEQGQGLQDFALWCALAEKSEDGGQQWPGSPSDVPAGRRQELASRIEFHIWLQWLCDEQLAAAQHTARNAGMDIGVVHDLAVGVSRNGADAWMLQDVLTAGVQVGAPPDMFNQQGQDWGQPPWHPQRLAEFGYAAYRDMLRTILRHAGGIRVDHILGLFRLWWIPDGAGPADGAYVYYDHDALIGILALEAEKAGAVVIGEDLGLFEPVVQKTLAGRGMLGTSILWFEYDGERPRPADQYRQACLTTVTTHDLPPSAGYLAGEHVDLRESLGLLSRPVEEERRADREAQDAVLSLVRSVTKGSAEQGTVEQLHSFIAHTPSVLLGISLADAVGERRTQNQPGTSDEYPNWRVPLADTEGRAVLVEDLASSEIFDRLAQAVAGKL
ncbi:4-alpha-glucanotransferase [Arthrobacter roseus]|uniref:4-alpha-glucanotransferase n=1 Tax=Arthrobacter roseus TaxID=136274 RepID=UPI0019665BE2|nr:4-alpha-glucanotransferase [Arthrobacter roseus]MBM7846830.1 4-alpha-glucanotransferase [Arthrobacter roseus]